MITFVVVAAVLAGAAAARAESLDMIVFGDTSSEQRHGFTHVRREVIRGGLGEPARQLLPLSPVSFNGGSVSLNLCVDPGRQKYFTVKLWGSDQGEERGRLILYLKPDIMRIATVKSHFEVDSTAAKDLIAGKPLKLSGEIKVLPHSTVALWLGE